MMGISDTIVAQWLEQVADGLQAGLASRNALSLAAGLPRLATQRLESVLESGRSWGEAMAEADFGLSSAELSIVRAAERSATLPQAMRSLAAKRRERAQVRRRVLWAAAYPTAVLHVAAIAFSVRYLMEGQPAAFAVALSMGVVPLWLVLGGGWMAFRLWPSMGRKCARWVPYVASFRLHQDMATLCGVLAACLRAGMSLESSWNAAAEATSNDRLREMADEVIAAARSGSLASSAVQRRSRGLPESFLQLYRSGENTGNLERNLESAAARYAEEAKRSLFVASMLYPKLMLAAILGYAGYRIVLFYSEYFKRIMEMGS